MWMSFNLEYFGSRSLFFYLVLSYIKYLIVFEPTLIFEFGQKTMRYVTNNLFLIKLYILNLYIYKICI